MLTIQTTDNPHDMNLEELTKKLTTLLALITAQRCQTLVKLNINHMQNLPDRIVFQIRDKIKTTRPGKYIEPVEILLFPTDKKLCPVAHIREYISRTQNLRQDQQLLISYHKPHKAVGNSTIGRWVKSSTSCGLMSGIPLKDILKAGGWSTATTFARHYNKTIDTNFGQALLNQFVNN